MPRRSSLVKKSENGLFELCQCSSRRHDSPTEPERDPQTEAPAIGHCNKFFDLIDEPLAALAIAVERGMDLLDVAPSLLRPA
jgi:hypothetical protein